MRCVLPIFFVSLLILGFLPLWGQKAESIPFKLHRQEHIEQTSEIADSSELIQQKVDTLSGYVQVDQKLVGLVYPFHHSQNMLVIVRFRKKDGGYAYVARSNPEDRGLTGMISYEAHLLPKRSGEKWRIIVEQVPSELHVLSLEWRPRKKKLVPEYLEE